ncbi:MAG TPA: NHL repeat-containing protein [Terracidiphilus sp.]|nr:NHL repeat-containing protein [Terracidiphilus sp.]
MRTLWAIPSLSVVLLISGCLNAPLVTTNQNTSNQNQGTAFSGKVHGGQQAVTGASVYLYAAGTSGYAGPGIAPTASNASVSLLKSAANTSQDGSGNYYVTTDSGGNFSITGDYTCPANAQVYLYSIGGNPGMGAGNNSAAGFLAALGPCSSLTSSTFVFVDEVSTITTAFALAGFTTDATHISSSNGAQALMGIKNAFATVANLENLSTGFALSTTPAGNGTFDISGVNVMADILAACVNSTGPTSTQCSTLFTNTMNGSTAPTDTAMAAINIAHNPSANVSTLFTLKTANSPFQPTWYRSGNSFSIVISYTGGGIQEDQGVAIDASGNVWVGNSQNNSLTEVSPLGVVMTPAAGLKGGGVVDPFGIAIDTAGNVWVNDAYPAGLSEYNPKTSTWVTSSAITGGGENFPEGIAIDPAGNLWIANEGNDSLSEYNPSTGWVSATGYTGGGLNMPHAIAVDLAGNVWITNSNASSISQFSTATGAPNTNSPITGGGLQQATGVAVDAQGYLWMSNYNNKLSEYDPVNGWVSTTGYTTGLSLNTSLAVDGAGLVWVANGQGLIYGFTSSGAALPGYTALGGGYLNDPVAIAIDPSGNLWAVNGNGSDGNLSEVVGLCTPVVTPIAANLVSPYGQHIVNKP